MTVACRFPGDFMASSVTRLACTGTIVRTWSSGRAAIVEIEMDVAGAGRLTITMSHQWPGMVTALFADLATACGEADLATALARGVTLSPSHIEEEIDPLLRGKRVLVKLVRKVSKNAPEKGYVAASFAAEPR